MKETSLRFIFLLTKYLNKSATTTEIEALSDLLQTLETEEITKMMEQVYEKIDTDTVNPIFNLEKSKDILQNILSTASNKQAVFSRKKDYSLFYKLGIAATISTIIFSLIFFRSHNGSKDDDKAISPTAQLSNILPGGNRATLKMANGSIILLDSFNNGILARDKGTTIKKIAQGQLVFDAQNLKHDTETSVGLNTIYTPRGGQYQITLPDGSKVWLNAETAIKFPSKFIGAERTVELSGEAYFEIAKNTSQPFKVISNRVEVQVLGTSFNLSDYKDEAVQKTTLFNGAVKINYGKQVQLLKPGEQGILTTDNRLELADNVDIEVEIAWKNGLFLFRDASVKDVMAQVARWYNVDVTYEGENSKKLFNGSISRNANLNEVMSMLAFTGVAYEIKERSILIKN